MGSAGDGVVTGITSSATDFPILDAVQGVLGGDATNAFVAKFTDLSLPVVSLSTTNLDFGSFGISFSSASRTLTLSSSGTLPGASALTISGTNTSTQGEVAAGSPSQLTQSTTVRLRVN